MLLADDLEGDFIEMPFVSGTGQPPSDLVSERLTELACP
jgi:hypothetical protein